MESFLVIQEQKSRLLKLRALLLELANIDQKDLPGPETSRLKQWIENLKNNDKKKNEIISLHDEILAETLKIFDYIKENKAKDAWRTFRNIEMYSEEIISLIEKISKN